MRRVLVTGDVRNQEVGGARGAAEAHELDATRSLEDVVAELVRIGADPG